MIRSWEKYLFWCDDDVDDDRNQDNDDARISQPLSVIHTDIHTYKRGRTPRCLSFTSNHNVQEFSLHTYFSKTPEALGGAMTLT